MLAFVTYSSGSSGGSASEKLRTWANGTGLGQQIGTLQADGARITAVVTQNRGTGAVHADCAVLDTDASTANGSLPSPDTQVTNLLSQAYTLEGDAAGNCYNAGATNHQLLLTSSHQRVRAEALMDQALARITAVTGATVSTTTTTVPDVGGIFG